MFGFLKKKRAEPKHSIVDENKNIAELNFVVDPNGEIWVECKWDTEVNTEAHMFFADMLDRVCDGQMLESALGFIKEESEENGRIVEYQAILAYLLEASKERNLAAWSQMISTSGEDFSSVKDSLVVNPTDILDRGHPHEP